MTSIDVKPLAVKVREEIPHSTVTLDEKSAFHSYIGPEELLTDWTDNVTRNFMPFAMSKRPFYSTLTLEMTVRSRVL